MNIPSPSAGSVPDEKKLIKKACRAHTDLNIFAAVVALMEHSLLSSDSQNGEARVIKICQSEIQKCLRRYDSALDLLAKDRP